MAQLGSVVGKRYRIAALIGAGGMSTVYLAIDQTLNKQWAVKEIRSLTDPIQKDLVIKSLTTEANLIKKFDHPAIPRIVDLFEESGRLYVVMDYIEGRTLADVVKTDGVQSEEDVVNWGIQLCDILEYLHRRNPPVIYRDIKPSNIMITPEGVVKLIDFGIAREVTNGKSLTAVGDSRRLGTLGFAAPEQLDYDKTYDDRVDQYALGASLYYLLTASHPRSHGIQPLRQINPSYSVGLESVISRATAENPEDRFESQAHMAYALRHYKEQDEAHVMQLHKTYNRFRTVIGAGIVLTILAGIFFGLAFWAESSDYNYWMTRGRQSSEEKSAAKAFIRASQIRRSSIEPYEELIKLYIGDQVFSSAEETQLNNAINDNLEFLKRDSNNWAKLNYEVGTTYWYYFDGFKDEYAGGQFNTEQARSARIRAAAQWMRSAAADKKYENASLAQVYADTAEFNNSIVPLIAQGSDHGKYAPYFKTLQDIVLIAKKSGNIVIKLDVADLVDNAVTVYGRNFKADGVKKADIVKLAKDTFTMIKDAQTVTSAQDKTKEDILGGSETVLELLNRAYTEQKQEGN
ncbi:serine/threonine protein kinase [Alloscardovia venturai]|uniref:non-specific serine/threonine protein kinase n=1 Tax=Alloscardovia venturai TaxID=1769421 RepID=A0ABW2Y487_9BIFI